MLQCPIAAGTQQATAATVATVGRAEGSPAADLCLPCLFHANLRYGCIPCRFRLNASSAGLFLASLAVHYIAEAKRYMPEALALYCRIMHAVAPPKAAALLSAASTAGRSQQKRPDSERHPKASAPDGAGSHMGQILVHPLDSLDWTAVSAEQGQEHASIQALSLVSSLDNQAQIPDTLQFRSVMLL